MGVLSVVVRGSSRSGEGWTPLVSVVIASRDEAEPIIGRLENCIVASYSPARIEFIVALDSQGAIPDSERLSAVDHRVKVVLGDEPGGKAATLNAGARASRGEVLVFMDTHQRSDRGAIGELVAALADEEVGAASGSLELPARNRPSTVGERYWQYERWLRSCEAKVHSAVGVTGAIFAVRCALWEPLPAGLILDDLYTPMQIVLAGKRVAFVEEARAYETRQHRPLEEYHRKVRTLTGVVQLGRWLPAVLLPWRNPIWVQFVCHKLLRLLTPYCLLGLAVWIIALGYSTLGYPFVVGLTLVLAITALAIWRSRTVEESGDGVWGLLAQGALLQAAIVVGTINGLMGRWDVWRR